MNESCIICFEPTNNKIKCNQCINKYACFECIKKTMEQRNINSCFVCGNGNIILEPYSNETRLFTNLNTDLNDDEPINEIGVSPIPNSSSFQTRHEFSTYSSNRRFNRRNNRYSNRYAVNRRFNRFNRFHIRNNTELFCSIGFILFLLSLIIAVIYGLLVFFVLIILKNKDTDILDEKTIIIISLIVIMVFIVYYFRNSNNNDRTNSNNDNLNN